MFEDQTKLESTTSKADADYELGVDLLQRPTLEGGNDDQVTGTQRTFRVTVPGDGDPRRLMLDLFREHYGFTDEDLAASASLNLVPTDKVGGGNALTAKAILAKARTTGGKFTLTVTAAQDQLLRRFKQDRSREGAEAVRTVVEAFIPIELGSVLQPLLTAIVAGTREQRLQAARQLQALIYDGKAITPAVAKQLREAIDGLQVQFGRGNDAVLSATRVQLMMAEQPVKMTLADTLPTTTNPLDLTADTRSEPVEQLEAQRTRALQQIAVIYKQIQERRTAGTLDRKEASVLYQMTAFLHEAYTGDREAAARDRATARLYLSNQGERDRAEKELGDARIRPPVISRRDPDEPTSMRASTKDERELYTLETEQAYEEWAELNRQVQVPTFPQTDVFKSQRSEGRGETTNARVDAARGGLTLIRTFVRWYVAHQRMMELAARRERIAELQTKIARDNTVVVPPKPAELDKLIAYLEAQAENAEPARAAKLRAQATKIRGMLDLARAFWDQ